MPGLHIVLLAAGKGTRMKSAIPKVLHAACGLPLIEHVLRAAAPLSPETVVVVVGHEAELVMARLASRSSTTFAVQEPQLGTDHALLQAEPALSGKSGTVVVLSGDVPLLRGRNARPASSRRTSRIRRSRDRAHGHRYRPHGLRADRPRRTAASLRSWNIGTRRLRSGRSPEVNSAIYAFDLGAAVRVPARDWLRKRAGGVRPPRSRPDLSGTRTPGGDRARSTIRPR